MRAALLVLCVLLLAGCGMPQHVIIDNPPAADPAPSSVPAPEAPAVVAPDPVPPPWTLWIEDSHKMVLYSCLCVDKTDYWVTRSGWDTGVNNHNEASPSDPWVLLFGGFD